MLYFYWNYVIDDKGKPGVTQGRKAIGSLRNKDCLAAESKRSF